MVHQRRLLVGQAPALDINVDPFRTPTLWPDGTRANHLTVRLDDELAADTEAGHRRRRVGRSVCSQLASSPSPARWRLRVVLRRCEVEKSVAVDLAPYAGLASKPLATEA